MKQLCSVVFLNIIFISPCIGCHADIDNRLKQYVIGYGSLMNEHSINRTVDSGSNNEPILVKGFRRGWYLNPCAFTQSYVTTFLAAVRDPDNQFNAVVFSLSDPKEIAKLDKRERSYCRTQVPVTDIKYLHGETDPKGQYWLYVLPESKIKAPSERCPIVQSYVDLFMAGCLDVEKNFKLDGFATQCVTSTYDWSDRWVNDRIFPHRAMIHQPKAYKIDKILAEAIPKIFAKIKIQ